MTTKWELLDLLSTSFKRFLYDPFLSTENMILTKTGTADESRLLHDLKLSTGILEGSTLKLRYNNNIFNPWYSEAYFHLHLNSMKNVFAFFGFKESVGDPASLMTENHVGVILENEKVYFSTGDGKSQQKVEISGLNATSDYLYKIVGSKLYTFPFPQIIPYMDTFRIITPDRIWTLRQHNTTFVPEDQIYYCIYFIKNLVGEDKFIRSRKFIYGEEYAD